jgi:hypothetical protein
VLKLSDLSNSALLLLCVSVGCDIEELLLKFDKLLLIDKLGRRIVPAKVSDLFGTSTFPVATKVCEGSSSGCNAFLSK